VIAQMSDIMPLIHDMCINSCLVYTGPFATLKTCPTCGESWYDQIMLANSDGKVKKPWQEFLSAHNGRHYGGIQIALPASNTAILAQHTVEAIWGKFYHGKG